MFVCLCRAVSDHAIEAAVHAGAATVEEVSARTDAASVCGNCLYLVEQIVAEVLAEGGERG